MLGYQAEPSSHIKLFAPVLVPNDLEMLEAPEIVLSAGIWNRLNALCADTEEEVLTFAPGGAHTEEQLNESRALNVQMFTRGIHSRTIYLNSVRNNAPTLSYTKWLNEYGSEVRIAPALPLRMIISDWKTAVLPLDPAKGMQGIAVYHDPSVVFALHELFERIWLSAKPLGLSRANAGDTISENERAVLEFLAMGESEKEMAHRMGCSDRTIRRIVNDLKTYFRAKNAAEIVYKATKQGWI